MPPARSQDVDARNWTMDRRQSVVDNVKAAAAQQDRQLPAVGMAEVPTRPGSHRLVHVGIGEDQHAVGRQHASKLADTTFRVLPVA